MNCRRNKDIFLLTLVFLIGFLLLMSGACEPNLPLQIENRTDMVLTIYVQDVKDGEVEPNNTTKIKDVPMTLAYYQIEAKNSKGGTVYSRKFSITELHDADWKVVILPSESK